MENKQLIHSTLSHDPDYLDLVQDFVAEMPSRQAAIRSYLSEGNLVQIQRAIHQLRGACGGYGFPSLTDSAAIIEESIKAGQPISSIEKRLCAFLDDLSRISAEPA